MHGVRELEPLQNEMSLLALPNGIYGFTVPWLLNTDPTGVVGGTGVSRIVLFTGRGGTSVMEVHKAQNGRIYIIGFAAPGDVERLQSPASEAALEVMLFMTPYQEFNRPVAIPVERIGYSNSRHVERSYVLDLLIVAGGRQTRPQPPTPTPAPIDYSAAPAPILIADSFDALRAYNGVTSIRPVDNDRPLNWFPNGVYGYAVPWIINTDPTGVVGGTGLARIRLSRERFGTLRMEVHKASTGHIFILGYMSEDQLRELGAAPEFAEVMVLFDPYQDFNRPVAIPIERILTSDNRSIRERTGTRTTIIDLSDMRLSTTPGADGGPVIVQVQP